MQNNCAVCHAVWTVECGIQYHTIGAKIPQRRTDVRVPFESHRGGEA